VETVLNLLLIRFAVIVGAVVLVVLLLFGIAIALKRRGHGDTIRRHADTARRYATPVVQDMARRRSGLARVALRYLDSDRHRNGDPR